MKFAGEFETHITVSLDASDRMDALLQWGEKHGLKCAHIVLDRGEFASQPMLTRRARGDMDSELKVVCDLSGALRRAGFPVMRVKMEVPPWNRGVPQTDSEATCHPADRYFEHHVKLALEAGDSVLILTEIVEKHSARLSRNALRSLSDGHQERFVTQRCRSVGRAEARRQLDALLRAIEPCGHSIIEVEEEFVVFDSNLALDAGWMRGEE